MSIPAHSELADSVTRLEDDCDHLNKMIIDKLDEADRLLVDLRAANEAASRAARRYRLVNVEVRALMDELRATTRMIGDAEA